MCYADENHIQDFDGRPPNPSCPAGRTKNQRRQVRLHGLLADELLLRGSSVGDEARPPPPQTERDAYSLPARRTAIVRGTNSDFTLKDPMTIARFNNTNISHPPSPLTTYPLKNSWCERAYMQSAPQ